MEKRAEREAALAAGWGHSLVLREAGGGDCWGFNFGGQAPPAGVDGEFKKISGGCTRSPCAPTAASSVGEGTSAARLPRLACAVRTRTSLPATASAWRCERTPGASTATDTMKTAVRRPRASMGPSLRSLLVIASASACALTAASSTGVSAAIEEGEPPAGVIEGDFVAVSAGVYHALALRSDGRAVAFGSYDVKGDEPAEGRAGPFRQVCAGWKHDVGLRLDNTVEAWGDNDRGQTEAQEGTFVAICAGDSHSLALGPDGVVQGWLGMERLWPVRQSLWRQALCAAAQLKECHDRKLKEHTSYLITGGPGSTLAPRLRSPGPRSPAPSRHQPRNIARSSGGHGGRGRRLSAQKNPSLFFECEISMFFVWR